MIKSQNLPEGQTNHRLISACESQWHPAESYFWPKVNKHYLLNLLVWSLWTNWNNVLVKKTTLEQFRFSKPAGFFNCTSAERLSLLPLLTRFSSKLVWPKVVRISMREVQHQSRLCKTHLCQKVSTISEESQWQEDHRARHHKPGPQSKSLNR